MSRAWQLRRRLVPFAVGVAMLAPAGVAAHAAAVAAGGGEASTQRQRARQELGETRKREREELQAVRRHEREEHQAAERRRREAATGTAEHKMGSVTISCASVTWHFKNFPAGRHTVTEIINVNGEHARDVYHYTFEGSSGENTTPITGPMHGVSTRIDARAHWGNLEVAGSGGTEFEHGWDITSVRTCPGTGPGSGLEVVKLQRVEGSGKGWEEAPVTAEVGQTILYEIKVANDGETRLTLENFSDPRCDPGTITGGQPSLLAHESTIFMCKHVVTPADQKNGSYDNVAEVTATPPEGEKIAKKTNTVEARVPTPGSHEPEPKKEPETTLGKGTTTSSSSSSSSGNGSPSGSFGVEATHEASAAAVPALSGAPLGCIRGGSFVVSIASRGVHSATFYVDGHRLRTLSAHAARHGRIAIRVYVGRLRVGVHTLKVRITMQATAASAKPRVATRSARFLRCASIAVRPHFTG